MAHSHVQNRVQLELPVPTFLATEAMLAKTRNNRTPESEMRVAALQVARSNPNGIATTTQLKEEIARYVNLTPEDLRRSNTRRNEQMYQQIVGNIVSHLDSQTNIFARGPAVYTGYGIQITQAGIDFLQRRGL
jgi:hypothetical protein